jgi:transposase
METKTGKRSRRKYDADFKKEVLKMIESGRGVPDVAQSLGIGTNLIYQWIKHSKANGNSSQKSSSVSFDAEKVAMHKKIKDLEMERDILKKALGIFSRQT